MLRSYYKVFCKGIEGRERTEESSSYPNRKEKDDTQIFDVKQICFTKNVPLVTRIFSVQSVVHSTIIRLRKPPTFVA